MVLGVTFRRTDNILDFGKSYPKPRPRIGLVFFDKIDPIKPKTGVPRKKLK